MKATVLGRKELEILKVLWRLQSGTVRDVYEALLKERKVAYTTVMTMMNTLERKGYLSKHLRERAYVYQPTLPQHEVMGAMVKDFVNGVFDGASKTLMVQLVKSEKWTPADTEEILRLFSGEE